MSNARLIEAYEVEAQDMDLQALMNDMMMVFHEETPPTPLDEYKVRKLMIARKMMQKEHDRLVTLRDAILDDWSRRIKKKQEEMENINLIIERYLKDVNKGKKLSLDVGTATLRKTSPKVKLVNENAAREFLFSTGELESFLKPAALDVTLFQNSFMNQLNTQVERMTAHRVTLEEQEKGKVSKKREAEIKAEVEQNILVSFKESLPDFMEYVPGGQSLSVTFK